LWTPVIHLVTTITFGEGERLARQLQQLFGELEGTSQKVINHTYAELHDLRPGYRAIRRSNLNIMDRAGILTTLAGCLLLRCGMLMLPDAEGYCCVYAQY
jgi:hypothetical protein